MAKRDRRKARGKAQVAPSHPLARPPRYEAWLDFYFGRFERDESDVWLMDWQFDASPTDLADLFVYTMENCGRDLIAFSDRQVAAGLESLLLGNYGNVPRDIIGAGPTDAQRVAVLRSFKRLYEDCFSSRAPPVLGHCSETQGNPLERIVYMLWDVSPFDLMARESDDRLQALLGVFEATLRNANEACIESALHGLGHLGGRARKKSQSLIDDWLDGLPQVRPALLEYARQARSGSIL